MLVNGADKKKLPSKKEEEELEDKVAKFTNSGWKFLSYSKTN